MGNATALLLVMFCQTKLIINALSAGRYLQIALVLGLIALPALANDIIRDKEYWLWSGVRTQPLLTHADTIYLLRGEVNYLNHLSASLLTAQGSRKIITTGQKIWLVYRAHSLNWGDNIYDEIITELERWYAKNGVTLGIQIDFDVPTQKLQDYADFLQRLRQRLPSKYRLSITGLLDWGSHADPTTIASLNLSVDEVIFQTYQGRHTIPNYQVYLEKLKQISLPFKVGIVQDGEWEEPSYLWDNPSFKGFVLFLVNRKP